MVDLHAVHHSRRSHRRRAGPARPDRDEPCRDAALGITTIAPDPADTRAKPPRSGWVIHATASGRQAQKIWRPLTGVIEERWAARFGAGAIAVLKESLRAVARQLDPALPDCLPILGYGLWSTPDRERQTDRERPARDRGRPARDRERPARDRERPARDRARPAPDHQWPAPEPGRRTDAAQPRADLPALLSRVLLAFAVEFEHESPVSLAISANVLRVLDEHGVRVRDLPGRSGVSREGISMAMGILAKRGLAVSGPAPDGGRWPVATLTPRGRNVQNKCRERLSEIGHRWQARFGGETVSALREALDRAGGPPPGTAVRGVPAAPRLLACLSEAAGHAARYPMVLHRGGFPGGS